MRNRILLSIVVLLGVSGMVGGLIWLGGLAEADLQHHPRYRGNFRTIRCPAPEGMVARDFLDEVQYLSRMPEDFSLLERKLPTQLAEAFANHPWVETVERIEVHPSQGVIVHLRFRKPVLAIRWQSQLRAIDKHGILLPSDAKVEGLPIYSGIPEAPRGPAGTSWGDPRLLEAVRNWQ